MTVKSASMTAKGASGQTATATLATLTYPNYLLFKSTPTVTIAKTGDKIDANGDYGLINVTVGADSAGPVGLWKMTFKVTTTTVDISPSDFTFYNGTNLVTQYTSVARSGLNYADVDSGSNHYSLIEVYFFDENDPTANVEYVEAGSSKTYTLRANVTGFTNDVSNSVSTSMLGDAAVTSSTYNKNAVAVDALDNNDFIWSDLSYGNTTTTATDTIEWMNGFLVDGLISTTSSAKSI